MENYLITGGTGSFGKAYIKQLLERSSVKRVVVYSRDEMKQWEMSQDFRDPRIRFFIGDVRDPDRLRMALKGIDIVVHAAAMKIVETAEYNPFECVKTNILGAMNIVDTCLSADVKRVVALSTDKASSPSNLYGATKLASDKIFTAANAYSGEKDCKFSVVRYGNVIGSRGSVVQLYSQLRQQNADELPVTDLRMTRFVITLSEAVNFVDYALGEMVGGEVFVKKIPSIKIEDIASAFGDNFKLRIIGIRPGEKLHEEMIANSEIFSTREFVDHFRIYSPASESENPTFVGDQITNADFRYSSDLNDSWLSSSEFRLILERESIL